MLKRLMDVAGAGVGLVLLSPVMAAAAIAVLVSTGRPVLFRQERPGLNGRPFHLLKFRTMLDRVDASGQLLKDELRLTRVGQFLRATSLDELPSLWSVLTGDMSLVGPRPLLMRYLPRYTPEQMRRHEVKPGVTGWAQVNGRNAISWEEKFAFDVWYVDNRSIWLDLRILAMTLAKVVRRKDINAGDVGTMPEFFGSGDCPAADQRSAALRSAASIAPTPVSNESRSR